MIGRLRKYGNTRLSASGLRFHAMTNVKVQRRRDYNGVGKQNRNKVVIPFKEMINLCYQLSASYVMPKQPHVSNIFIALIAMLYCFPKLLIFTLRAS